MSSSSANLHLAGSPYASSTMNETYKHMHRSGCAVSSPGPRTLTLSKKQHLTVLYFTESQNLVLLTYLLVQVSTEDCELFVTSLVLASEV